MTLPDPHGEDSALGGARDAGPNLRDMDWSQRRESHCRKAGLQSGGNPLPERSGASLETRRSVDKGD